METILATILIVIAITGGFYLHSEKANSTYMLTFSVVSVLCSFCTLINAWWFVVYLVLLTTVAINYYYFIHKKGNK